MSEDKVPTLPADETFSILETPLIRLVRNKPVYNFFQASLTSYLQLPGASDTAASFEFEAEDHTLGNALRYIIMQNPEVELCGYSIPHPSEAKMNIRIQTYVGTSVYDVLEKGFNDLMDLCDVVTEKFTSARDELAAQKQSWTN